MNFSNLLEENKKIIISNLQKLIQIPSVYDEKTVSEKTPFGQAIEDALAFMLNLGADDGFEIVKDGGYAGHISYGQGQEIVGILCHLDVVPEGNNWDYPPFSGQIVNDLMYGRGTMDDKGPTIAAYYALKIIKDAKIKLRKQIRIILGTDEETHWRGIKHYLKNYPMPNIGFAPDANFPLVYGEKGRIAVDIGMADILNCDTQTDMLLSLKGGERYNVVMDEVTATSRIDISRAFLDYLNDNKLKGDVQLKDNIYYYTLFGKAAHAMEPFKGINACTHMCNFLKNYSHNKLVAYIADMHHLDYYLEKLNLDYNHEEMGPITCNIGIIDFDKNKSRLTLDLRYPITYDVEKFKEILNLTLKQYSLKVVEFSCKSPHYVSPNDHLVTALYEAYVKHTNDHINKPMTIGGETYASILNKAVAFGMEMPGEEVLAHQRNEYVKLSTLFTSILIYIDAIIALGEIDA